MAKTSTALLVAVVTLAFTSVVNATNNYPIILVHGLAGFGRGEAFGIPYWGTLQGDFQEKLKSEGYTVYTVAVGKVSSDWDRAVELYAQIKGGTVDYGANHSATYGHKRYGRTYPGYFPQWGTVVNGKLQKVHLIGHSMGGTTIRMLTQMLNTGTKGSATEEDPASHPLFAGGKDWVHSVSTLSTPIVGSTLADFLGPGLDLIKGAIATTFGIAGLTGDLTKSIYDPILDQWGITPKAAGESLDDYLTRIAASKLYAPGNPDNAGISLAVKTGAKAQNKWVKTLPNVYYYSFVSEGTYNTRDLLFQRIALPNTLVNNPLINPLATLMGSRNTIAMGFTDDWLANDGFVNVIAQGSDLVSKVIDFAGTSQRGAWVRFKTLRMDHTGLMGTNPLIPVYPIYKAHAALLADLPAHEALTTSRSLRGNVDEEAEVNAGIHDAPQAIVQAVFAAQDPLA